MTDKEIGMKLENAALKLIIAFFTIVVVGTAAIPAVLAYRYTWMWLLIYPVCLGAFLLYASRFKK